MMIKWTIPDRPIWRAVLLLLRDAHGRFTRIRYPKPSRIRRRRTPRRPTTAVQLVLF